MNVSGDSREKVGKCKTKRCVLVIQFIITYYYQKSTNIIFIYSNKPAWKM